jgi:hypothetical protein
MAKHESRDPELEALKNIEGVDSAKITAQVNKAQGIEETVIPPPATPPPATNTPATPPVVEPPKNVPDTETIRTAMLNEMFGEQFKTVEDVKKANISASLKELANLRQKNQELTDTLAKKPKHAFASDDLAKLNEFVRETGIKDVSVFNVLNSTDIANMDNVDALVWQRVLEDPDVIAELPRLRKSIEKKFNVIKGSVEEGTLTQEEYDDNLFELRSEAIKAKKTLTELKSKIKMPEVPVEEPSKKWTPEIEARQKSEWTKVNEEMGKVLSTIPIKIKGSTEPIVNFVVPEETKKAILQTALDYAVSNQMEINEANIKPIAETMYSQIIVSNLDQIAHAVFERARSMTQEDALKLYHNPSPKQGDTPPAIQEPLSAEVKAKRAFEAEMSR